MYDTSTYEMISSMICNARVVTVNIHRSGHKIPNRVCKHVLTHTSSAIETILESIAALYDIAARFYVTDALNCSFYRFGPENAQSVQV